MEARIHNWEKSNYQTLDISGLKLRSWPQELQGKEHLIIKFDCSGNKLTKLPLLPECTYLNCHSNLISHIGGLPKCQELVCYFNRLEKLPDDLSECVRLCFDYNKVTMLPEDLEKCKHICCKGNNIKNIDMFKHRDGLTLNY